MQLDTNKTCTKIAKQLNLDRDLVYNVVMHQFKFIKEIMQDPNDIHDILINKLFKFKLKSRFKDNKSKYTSK